MSAYRGETTDARVWQMKTQHLWGTSQPIAGLESTWAQQIDEPAAAGRESTFKTVVNRVWWYVSIIPGFRRWRWGDQKFKASLGHMRLVSKRVWDSLMSKFLCLHPPRRCLKPSVNPVGELSE